MNGGLAEDARPGRERSPAAGRIPLSIRSHCPVVGKLAALAVDEWGLRRGRTVAESAVRVLAPTTHGRRLLHGGLRSDRLTSRVPTRRHQFLSNCSIPGVLCCMQTRLDDTAAAIAAGHSPEQFARLKSDESGEHPGNGSHGLASGCKGTTWLARWPPCVRGGPWPKPPRRSMIARTATALGWDREPVQRPVRHRVLFKRVG